MIHNKDLDTKKRYASAALDRIISNLELQTTALDRQIYYSPSYVPMITNSDQRRGSCWQDVTVPTAAWMWNADQQCWLSRWSQSIDLRDYSEIVLSRIARNVSEIYDHNSTVLLALSGGIDSLVLLSQVVALGLLSRTEFVCVRNRTQCYQDSIHDHPVHSDNLRRLLHTYPRPTHTLDVTLEDFADAFNHGSMMDCQCYVTRAICRNFKDKAIMFGWHGNQVLLHKDYLLDEILDRCPSRLQDVQQQQAKDSLYTESVRAWKPDKAVPLRFRNLLVKPWMLFNGCNNNTLHSPLGDDVMFALLRQLDFATVPVDVVCQALVAKQAIERTCPDLLQYVYKESHHDMDTLERFEIPSAMIDPAKITVPMELHHDPQGLDYINQEISRNRARGSWPVNSLVAMKSLHWIQQLLYIS